MTFSKATTSHWDSITQPNCSDCGTATELFGLEAERPGCELQTFVCPKCHGIQTAVGKEAYAPRRRGHAEAKVPLTPLQCLYHADECIAIAQHSEKENLEVLNMIVDAWLHLAKQLLPQERPVIVSSQKPPPTETLQ